MPTRQRTQALVGVLVAAAAMTRFLLDGDSVAGSFSSGAIVGALTFTLFWVRAALIEQREGRRSSSCGSD